MELKFRSRAALPHFDPKLSLADAVDRDKLDEEFDVVLSNRPPEMVRSRYDKLCAVGARVQTILSEVAAQGEKMHALMTWRDPWVMGIFMGLCFLVALVMYLVPTKMVVVDTESALKKFIWIIGMHVEIFFRRDRS